MKVPVTDYKKRLELFPLTTQVQTVGGQPTLTIAGLSLAALADQYGTPLYLYDRFTMDANVDAYRQALAAHYPGPSGITYAGKSFLCLAVAQWVDRQGLLLDCTGAGEIHVAVSAGVARKRILVHGVNKSPADLAAAVRYAGTIVVDNLTELERLEALHLSAQRGRFPELWLRLRPGLAVDTHAFRQTGQEDSKFGMSLEEAAQAIAFCRKHHLPLHGLHFHQGSHFHDPNPLGPAIELVTGFIAAQFQECGWRPHVLCVGGGWGTPYHEDDLPHLPIESYVAFTAQKLIASCQEHQLPLPQLQFEPGRSLVARAGVSIYRLGALKRTASRRWLMIDGGMVDNPRPALYGARYSALPVTQPDRPFGEPAWLAGPYCESGDILIEALPMPDMQPGELVAIPVSGAYQVSMSSNYNGACRPAVIWLDGQGAHIILEREQPEDLLRRERSLPG